MTPKITDTKRLHVGEGFQEKLLLKNATTPDRDLLAMKLLGIDGDLAIRNESGTSREGIKICKKGTGKKEIDNLLAKDKLFAMLDQPLQSFVDGYRSDQNINLSHIDVSWIKTTHENNANNKKIKFTLENSSELEDSVKDLLNYEGDKDYLNILVLLPVGELVKNGKDCSEELGWDIYEQAFDEENTSHDDQLALIMALQILELGSIANPTCYNIVKDTVLTNKFDHKDYSDFVGDKYRRRYFVALKNKLSDSGMWDVVNATVSGKPFKKTKLRNINKEEFDAKEARIIEQALSNIDNLKRDKKVRLKGVDNREVKLAEKSKVDSELDKDFETIAYSLRNLLIQVPGVLCKIKIPFNAEYYERLPSGRKKNDIDTWIFGPEYWIQFLENSAAEIGAKPGSDDRKVVVKAGNNEATEVVYDFGYCIHHMGYLSIPRHEIKCEKCGKVRSYDCSTLKWNRVSSNERSLGTVELYRAVIEDKCSCGELSVATFTYWDYPEGVKVTSEVEFMGQQR